MESLSPVGLITYVLGERVDSALRGGYLAALLALVVKLVDTLS